MAGFPTNCSKCQAAIYAQWWDTTENAYRCRVCGTLNPGLRPELAPAPPRSRFLVGCLIALWGVVILWGFWVLSALARFPEYLADPERFEGGETGLYGFLLAIIGVPWLLLLVITAVATWRLRRRG
jgi:hypothetical protein